VGGAGNDTMISIESKGNSTMSCGEGQDLAWADALDAVAPDCELQDQALIITLPESAILPVSVPCAAGTCAGTVAAFTAAAPTSRRSKAVPGKQWGVTGKALGRRRFKLGPRSRRTVRMRLARPAVKRLKRLGPTTVESRTSFTQSGKHYVVKRRFLVIPR
jgi:hypothetical protein